MSARGGIVRRFHGSVVHVRSGRVRHRLRHPYHAVLVDADRIAPDGRRPLLGIDPARVLPTLPGATIRDRVDALLRLRGVEPSTGRLLGLLTLRPFGIGFDPITIWWCHDVDGTLHAVVLDVHNTSRQAYPYVIPVDDSTSTPTQAHGDPRKAFHVSPFLPMEGDYDARIDGILDGGVPDGRVAARVTFHADDGTTLVAVLAGRLEPARVRLRDVPSALAAATQGVRSLVQIHRHALTTWRRGAPFRRAPARSPRPDQTHSHGTEDLAA